MTSPLLLYHYFYYYLPPSLYPSYHQAYDISQQNGRLPDNDLDILEAFVETFDSRAAEYGDKINEIYWKLQPALEEGMMGAGNDPYVTR